METKKVYKDIVGKIENKGYNELTDSSADKLLGDYESFSIYAKTSKLRNLRKLCIVIKTDKVDTSDIVDIEEDIQMIMGKYANKDTYRQKKIIGYNFVISNEANAKSLIHTKLESGFSSHGKLPFYRLPIPIGIQVGCQTALIDAENDVFVIGDSNGVGIQKKFWTRNIKKIVPKYIEKDFTLVDSSSDEIYNNEIDKVQKIVKSDSIDIKELNDLLNSSNKFKISLINVLENKGDTILDSINTSSISPNNEKIDNINIDINTSNDEDIFEIIITYKDNKLYNKSVTIKELRPIIEMALGKFLMKIPYTPAKMIGSILISDAKANASGKVLKKLVNKSN